MKQAYVDRRVQPIRRPHLEGITGPNHAQGYRSKANFSSSQALRASPEPLTWQQLHFLLSDMEHGYGTPLPTLALSLCTDRPLAQVSRTRKSADGLGQLDSKVWHVYARWFNMWWVSVRHMLWRYMMHAVRRAACCVLHVWTVATAGRGVAHLQIEFVVLHLSNALW
jgi:hypothetical protein